VTNKQEDRLNSYFGAGFQRKVPLFSEIP